MEICCRISSSRENQAGIIFVKFSHEIGFRTGWRTKYVFRSIYVWPLISSSLMHIQFIKNNIVRILAGMHLISNTNNKIWEEVNTENSQQKTKYYIGQSLLKRWLGASRQIKKAICFNQNWIIFVGFHWEWV